jgi:hypothetical protein
MGRAQNAAKRHRNIPVTIGMVERNQMASTGCIKYQPQLKPHHARL